MFLKVVGGQGRRPFGGHVKHAEVSPSIAIKLEENNLIQIFSISFMAALKLKTA